MSPAASRGQDATLPQIMSGSTDFGELRRFLAILEELPDFVVSHQQAGRLLAAAWARFLRQETPAGPLLSVLRRDGASAAAQAAAKALPQDAPAEDLRAVAILEFLAARLDHAAALTALALAAAPPGRAADWRLLGLIRYGQGRLADATAAYRNGLSVDPGFAELWRNLARAHRSEGGLDDADRLLDICLRARPGLSEAHVNRLMSLRARGIPQPEREYALFLLRDQACAPAARAAAVGSLLFLGEAAALRQAIRQLSVCHPGSPDALRAIAAASVELGDGPAARRSARRLSVVAETVEDWLSVAATLAVSDPDAAGLAARTAHAMAPDAQTALALRDMADPDDGLSGAAPMPRRPDGAFRESADHPLRLRGRSYRAFFAGHPALTQPSAGPPPPPAGRILRALDPSTHPASARELADDLALWEDGIFVAGPTDFDVLVVHGDAGGRPGKPSAHIVSADAHVCHRISQIPPRHSAATLAVIPSPVQGPVRDLRRPDWVVRLPHRLEVVEVEDAVFIGGHENYGHFLWEILSRAMAAHSFPTLRSLPVHALVHAPYQREMLALAFGGTPIRDIPQSPCLIRFRRSYAPRDLSYWSAIGQIRKALMSACGLPEAAPSRTGDARLFLSRAAHWPDRHRIADEDGLDDVLVRHGLEKLQADRLSIPDTIRLFASAGLIAGATGAQFANMPFCGPGVRLLDLAARYQSVRPIWHWSMPLVFGYARCLHHRLYGEDVFIEPGTALNWITRYAPAEVGTALDDLERCGTEWLMEGW